MISNDIFDLALPSSLERLLVSLRKLNPHSHSSADCVVTYSWHGDHDAEQQLWGVSQLGSHSDRDMHAGQSLLRLPPDPPTQQVETRECQG